MGSRRIGLKRTQALVQQLKRELTMGGTTFENSKVLGKSYVSSSGDTNGPGPGLQSGSVTAPVMRVQEVNGEVITTITLDLQGLSGSNDNAFEVIGNAQTPADAAYLYQHLNAINGILYKAEMSCIEDISTGGAGCNRSFVLSGSTQPTYGHGQAASGMGDPFAVMTQGGVPGTMSQGVTVVDNSVLSSDSSYVFLINGANGSGSAGSFTSGKLVIRLYGHKDF